MRSPVYRVQRPYSIIVGRAPGGVTDHDHRRGAYNTTSRAVLTSLPVASLRFPREDIREMRIPGGEANRRLTKGYVDIEIYASI